MVVAAARQTDGASSVPISVSLQVPTSRMQASCKHDHYFTRRRRRVRPECASSASFLREKAPPLRCPLLLQPLLLTEALW